jgi:hypothetical protein
MSHFRFVIRNFPASAGEEGVLRSGVAWRDSERVHCALAKLGGMFTRAIKHWFVGASPSLLPDARCQSLFS